MPPLPPTPPVSNVTVGGIDAAVLIDGFDYGINENGPYRDVVYLVDGSKGAQFCDKLLGIGSGPATFNPPGPHRYPNNTNLMCLSAGLQELKGPAMPDAFLIGSDQVGIKAHYGVPTWDAIGTDFAPIFDGYEVPWSHLSMEVGHEEYEAENIVVGGVEKPRSRVRLPTVTYTFRRTMIPNPLPYKTIVAGLVYKLNNAVFFGEPAGTIRFDSFAMNEEDRDPSGLRVFTFTSILTWRPINWNKMLVPGSANSWALPDSSADYPYQSADFRQIMTYGLA